MKVNRRKFTYILISIISVILIKLVFFRRNLFRSSIVNSQKNKHNYKKSSQLQNKTIVVRVGSKNLSNWNYTDLNYFKAIDQDEINRVMDKGICELTMSPNPDQAWNIIMKEYKVKDNIALRPNFNPADKNEDTFFNDIIIAPQIINYVIDSLHKYVGAPFHDIYIYELTRPIPEDLIKKYIKYDINYVEKPDNSLVERIKNKLKIGLAAPDFDYPIEMRENVVDEDGIDLKCFLPKIVTHSQHLINLSVFKYHQYGLLSGVLKNHYGTVRFNNLSHYPTYLHKNKVFKSTVDINRHWYLKSISRLHIIDNIFGAYNYIPLTPVKKKWQTFGKDGVPNSIFMGFDPVALESVLYDYLKKERDAHNLSTNDPIWIEDAANHNLGIFESSDELKYSKFDYIQMDLI
jgi:hypothetical protein